MRVVYSIWMLQKIPYLELPCKRWDWKTQFLDMFSHIATDSSGACCLFCALLRYTFKHGTLHVKCEAKNHGITESESQTAWAGRDL